MGVYFCICVSKDVREWAAKILASCENVEKRCQPPLAASHSEGGSVFPLPRKKKNVIVFIGNRLRGV